VFDAADVIDESYHVLFIFLIQPAVLIVPSLVVAEARDLDALAVVVGEVGFDVLCHVVDDLENPVVVEPGGTGLDGRWILADAGRQEVMAQALTAPAGLDEKHLALAGITHHMSKAEFRPDDTAV